MLNYCIFTGTEVNLRMKCLTSIWKLMEIIQLFFEGNLKIHLLLIASYTVAKIQCNMNPQNEPSNIAGALSQQHSNKYLTIYKSYLNFYFKWTLVAVLIACSWEHKNFKRYFKLYSVSPLTLSPEKYSVFNAMTIIRWIFKYLRNLIHRTK